MNNWQTIQPVNRVFVLPRCDIALYEDAGNGVLGSLVWTVESMESLRISESFRVVLDYLTGIPYPRRRHLDATHQITFDAVWNVSARLSRSTRYILSITWLDASISNTPKGWVRRYYHGVTTSDRDISSRDGNEFTSSNTLDAEYYVESEDGDATQRGGAWQTPQTGTYTPDPVVPGTETC